MSAWGWKAEDSQSNPQLVEKAATDCAKRFKSDWGAHHNGRQPLGYVLRQDPSLPWVRFHALPDSQRYAASDEEMDVILARGNSLASVLFGRLKRCWIITSRWDDERGPGVAAGHWREDDTDPESLVWNFFVRESEWAEGHFDDDLEDLADDAPYYIVWFEPDSGKVFAPYDGGFDLFAPSIKEVAKLRARFGDWLSDRNDGL